MSNQPAAQPVCPNCNYGVSGIPKDERGLFTCPECGESQCLKYSYSLTADEVHAKLIKRILLPTTIPPLCFLFVSWIPNLSMLFACLHVPAMAILALVVWIHASIIIVNESKPHTRPGPLWLIPILGFLYLIPGIVIEYIYIRIASMFIIPV